MTFKPYREESKKNWGAETENQLDINQIQLGAMLRIADATERMAQRHTELIRERDAFKSSLEYAEYALLTSRRKVAALKGHIKRLKNRKTK